MTDTEELHNLLDERGVKWSSNDMYRLRITSWDDANGHSWAFMEHRDGGFSELKAYHLTPEQVVASTLGPGTCTDVEIDGKRIVRCRDCKRFSVDQSDHDYRSGWLCDRWHTDMVEPNGFCAWGEQRKETGCSEAS